MHCCGGWYPSISEEESLVKQEGGSSEHLLPGNDLKQKGFHHIFSKLFQKITCPDLTLVSAFVGINIKPRDSIKEKSKLLSK